MRSSWYVVGFLSILSCDYFLKANSYYCDANTACQDGRTCDVAHHLCGPPIDPTAPMVTGLSQSGGSPSGGSTLTLLGQNFVPGMQVYIEGMVVAGSAFVSPTQLQFILPKGQCGQVITVTAKTADGQLATGAQTLRYKYTNLAFGTGLQAALIPGGMAMAAGLMDGDDTVDLIVVGSTPAVQILSGSGNLSFSAPVSLSATGSYNDVILADLNGKGTIDIVAGSNQSLDVYKCTGAKPLVCTNDFTSGSMNSAFTIADLDKNGGTDLITFDITNHFLVGYFTDKTLSYATGIPTYMFTDRVMTTPASALVAGDFNGDGLVDLATSFANDHSILAALGNGTKIFPTTAPIVLAVPNAASPEPPALLAAMKVDADNTDDLIIATSPSAPNPGSLFLALSQGTGFTTTRLGSIPQTPKLLVTEDIDCDGLKDIIVYYANSTSIDVYSNTGNGGFASSPQTVTLAGSILSISVANLNADDKPDLAVLRAPAAAAVTIYQNTSS